MNFNIIIFIKTSWFLIVAYSKDISDICKHSQKQVYYTFYAGLWQFRHCIWYQIDSLNLVSDDISL